MHIPKAYPVMCCILVSGSALTHSPNLALIHQVIISIRRAMMMPALSDEIADICNLP